MNSAESRGGSFSARICPASAVWRNSAKIKDGLRWYLQRLDTLAKDSSRSQWCEVLATRVVEQIKLWGCTKRTPISTATVMWTSGDTLKAY